MQLTSRWKPDTRFWIFGVLLALFAPLSGLAESVTGVIYEKGQGKKDALYRYERVEHEGPHGLQIKTWYSDLSGKKVVEEETQVKDGRLKVYHLSQHQIKADGEVRLEGDQAVFSYIRDGKKKSGKEKVEDNFVVGPTIVPYVQKHWAELVGGAEIKIRYAVLDRTETVGFTVTKMGMGTLNDRQVVMVKMKPSSAIIAALVDPLIFTFSADGAHLLELKGRTIPRKLVDGDWKDLDADIVYSGFRESGAKGEKK